VVCTRAALQVIPNHKPDDWNLKAMYAVSAVLGAIACVSSLLLLWAGLEAGSGDSLLNDLGVPALTFGEVMTMM
jgi:H+-transporting ATPase